MTQMTFALAAHRAKAGRYPKSLNDLVPEPYAKLPHDPFGGGPFRYQRRGDGYLLYSVGGNGEDDGGHGRWEDEGPPGADDIVVRIPAESL